tara:strand:- start:37 stop:159 length:123 start_codon:yes stop_codon:yes gene_type:complete
MKISKLDGDKAFVTPEPFTDKELEVAKKEIKEEQDTELKK